MLTREERFEATTIARDGDLVRLADAVLAVNEVRVLRPPVPASVMMRAIESAEGMTFNLGEVAVTEAEVELGGERGYAIVLGFRPAAAVAGAVLDAACAAGLDQDGEIEAGMHAAIQAEVLRLADEWNALAPTRVQFDEIPE